MFNRFETRSRDVVKDAHEVARTSGSATVEAEHVLLAIVRHPGPGAAPVLSEAGLDEPSLLAALAAEEEHSLAAVGVPAAAYYLPPAGARKGSPRWGASAKVALERSVKVAQARNDRRILPDHILLGVLRAPVGRVPRTLEEAGVDRIELASRVEDALAS